MRLRWIGVGRDRSRPVPSDLQAGRAVVEGGRAVVSVHLSKLVFTLIAERYPGLIVPRQLDEWVEDACMQRLARDREGPSIITGRPE